MNPNQFPYVGAPNPQPPTDQLPAPQPPSFYVGPSQDQTPEPKKQSGFKSALTTVLILASAPLLALFITSFVFQSYEVDGPSMENTLFNGERLVVLKFPKTVAEFTGGTWMPHRNSIVIFDSIEGSAKRQLIKRVIGLPGDHVVVKDGKVTVTNTEHPNGYDPDLDADHGINVVTTTGNVDLVVPEKEVFVLGDNRKNSQDSRSFGTVPAEKIVGRLYLRIFPLDKFQSYGSTIAVPGVYFDEAKRYR